MSVTASLVKELRERTGVGMMDCRKALVESNGNIELAIENMRKSGQAKAAKKASRVAAEGVLMTKINDAANNGLMVEVNCETDFVARDDNFLAFANSVAQLALDKQIDSIEELSATAFANGETVEQARQALIAKIGENINVRRIQIVNSSGMVGSYVHGGGRIVVLVDIENGTPELAKDIAMHCAAMNPKALNAEGVPQAVIDKEKEIFVAQSADSNKPAEIVEKIVANRLKKFLTEVSLYDQAFVKDSGKTVAQVLKEKKCHG